MRSRSLLIVVGLALVAAACSNPTYSRNSVERDLRDQSGLSADQARCVTRRLEDTIGVERLGARDDPTTREREKLRAALVFAALACGPRPYDADAAARVLRTKVRVPPSYADCLAREFATRAADVLPAPSVAWRNNEVRALQPPILASTIECARARGANVALELRRNLGISRLESQCVLDARTPADAFASCTSTSTTTTTTTTTSSTPTTTTSSTTP